MKSKKTSKLRLAFNSLKGNCDVLVFFCKSVSLVAGQRYPFLVKMKEVIVTSNDQKGLDVIAWYANKIDTL